MPGKTEGQKRSGWKRMRWLNSITDSMDMNLSKLQETVEERGAWCAAAYVVRRYLVTEQQQVSLCSCEKVSSTQIPTKGMARLRHKFFYTRIFKLHFQVMVLILTSTSSLFEFTCLISYLISCQSFQFLPAYNCGFNSISLTTR